MSHRSVVIPPEEEFELALEWGHAVKGFQHPERSIFYVN